MRQWTAFLAMMCIGYMAVAQAVLPSSKVSAAHSQKEIGAMSAEELTWKNFLSSEWCLVSVNPEKSAGLPVLSPKSGMKAGAITMTPETFNPFQWNINLSDENQYFRIEGTDMVVLALSRPRLEVLYTRYKANLNAGK
jgi:hypothetical protein